MESYASLGSELGSLIRVMKDLHAHVIQQAALPCEIAGAVVLSRLSQLGPVRLTDLAQNLMLDPSSVSRQVSALERVGLVTKEKDPVDLRAQRLVLTENGQQAVEAVRVSFAETLARLTPGWTDKDIEDLVDRMARLNTDLTANRALLTDRALAVKETA